MKKPIGASYTGRVAAPPVVKDSCGNCRFRDPNMMEGATKVMCRRFPKMELVRVTDWCGEYELGSAAPNRKE